MKKVPFILLYSRIVFSILILLLSITKPFFAEGLIVLLIVIGVLTDIFDGIFARKFGVSTEKMRSMDSKIDTVFWISVLICIAVLKNHFFLSHLAFLIILALSELICQTYSYIKFKRSLALHAYLAKAWALLITISSVAIITDEKAEFWFIFMFCFGVLSQLETLIIITILPKWHSDIPSLVHAIKIRRNLPVKRFKLFNG